MADPKQSLREPEPPAVMVAVAGLVPDAHDALPEDEFEARILKYQRLVELNQPLPLFGVEQKPQRRPTREMKQSQMQCWCCGLIATRRDYVQTNRKGPPALGPLKYPTPAALAKREQMARRERDKIAARWHSRPFTGMGDNTRETYCPTCFAKWGWPDEYEAVAVAVAEVFEILADMTPTLRDRGGI
jgi:hypothetical protein